MAHQLVHIESDPGLAEEVRRAFGPAGFSVLTVPAGEQALDRCRSNPPDLILLAAELPDMSGFSVCNRLKRALSAVPLILYTSEATPSAIEAHRATRTRADDYVRKPFDIADLVGRAAQLLQGPAAPTPAKEPPSSAPPTLPRASPPRRPPLPPTLGPTAAAPAAAPPSPATAGARAELVDPFADAPRDPAPPKGTPEEKLEFFRERLRARDAFLSRVREAFAAARSEAHRLTGEVDVYRSRLSAEAGARAALEQQAAELAATATEKQARAEELEKKHQETEATRQSLSDVLSETMQAHEASEQQWSLRVASAEEERARAHALHKEELARAEETLARRSAEWEAQREAWEQERAELQGRLAAFQTSGEDLRNEVKRLETQIEGDAATHQEYRAQAERDLSSAQVELSETRGRAEALAGELAAAQGRAEALEAELARRRQAHESLQAEHKKARAEAGAYGEKAVAAEQAYLAQLAELEAAKRRGAELAAALDEKRASVEGVKGEVTRLQGQLTTTTRELSQAVAARDQLAHQLEAGRRERDEARAAAARLEAEVARLSALEPQAADAVRLRRDLAQAQELLQQRTQQVESVARSAHDATSQRERVLEKLELEVSRLSALQVRRDSELSAEKKRVAELEQELGGRQLETRKASAEADAQRRGRAEEAVEAERRHLSEVSRLKSALVDLERRLEASAIAEAQARRRIAELERKGPGGPPPQELSRLQEKVQALSEELSDLKGENDFLNSEVARYHQKNKDLQTQLQRLTES